MQDPSTLIRNLALSLIPFVLSLTVHEFAHAWAATRLGDDTAMRQGRLTLSPGAHIDPLGTLIIPAASVLLGGVGLIAWAKPVPFNPTRFRKGVSMRTGAALVAAAGPLSNVFLALVTLSIMALLLRSGVALSQELDSGERRHTALGLFLSAMWTRNVALAMFNLLPFPPLDGHYLLPRIFDPIIRPLTRYGFAILMLLFMLPQLRPVTDFILYRPMIATMAFLGTTFGVIGS